MQGIPDPPVYRLVVDMDTIHHATLIGATSGIIPNEMWDIKDRFTESVAILPESMFHVDILSHLVINHKHVPDRIIFKENTCYVFLQ